MLDSAYKNTAPRAPQPQNLFICLRSCLLCFFSFTSSGADGLSAMNQGPRKFTQSRCNARAGAWDKQPPRATVTVRQPSVQTPGAEHVQYTDVLSPGIQKDIKFGNKNSQIKTQNNAF